MRYRIRYELHTFYDTWLEADNKEDAERQFHLLDSIDLDDSEEAYVRLGDVVSVEEDPE